MREECKHGASGNCMLCIREGEGKPAEPFDPNVGPDGEWRGPRYPGDEIPNEWAPDEAAQ
jgi:hypothetical protein